MCFRKYHSGNLDGQMKVWYNQKSTLVRAQVTALTGQMNY